MSSYPYNNHMYDIAWDRYEILGVLPISERNSKSLPDGHDIVLVQNKETWELKLIVALDKEWLRLHSNYSRYGRSSRCI